MSANFTRIMELVASEIAKLNLQEEDKASRVKNLCAQLYMIEINPTLSSHAKKKEMKEKIDHVSSII